MTQRQTTAKRPSAKSDIVCMIEHLVSKKTDLDTRYMRGQMSEVEYAAKVAALNDQWEDVYYRLAANGLALPHLGRIGNLAEDLRRAARAVTDNMRRTPGGDAFEYHGSTSAVDDLIDKLNALEDFQVGWVK